MAVCALSNGNLPFCFTVFARMYHSTCCSPLTTSVMAMEAEAEGAVLLIYLPGCSSNLVVCFLESILSDGHQS